MLPASAAYHEHSYLHSIQPSIFIHHVNLQTHRGTSHMCMNAHMSRSVSTYLSCSSCDDSTTFREYIASWLMTALQAMRTHDTGRRHKRRRDTLKNTFKTVSSHNRRLGRTVYRNVILLLLSVALAQPHWRAGRTNRSEVKQVEHESTELVTQSNYYFFCTSVCQHTEQMHAL